MRFVQVMVISKCFYEVLKYQNLISQKIRKVIIGRYFFLCYFFYYYFYFFDTQNLISPLVSESSSAVFEYYNRLFAIREMGAMLGQIIVSI